MKMTSKPILILLMLGLVFYAILFLALSQAWAASCNEKAVLCKGFPALKPVMVYGWQKAEKRKARIWPHPKVCKRVGPRYCPRRPTLRDMPEKMRLKTDVEGVCRAAVVADFRGRGENDHCSTGIFGKAFPVAGHVFGKSACMEHDICYSMPGTKRKECDRMCLKNLNAACKQYFFGHTGDRKAINALNNSGYASCISTARAGHTGVLAIGGAFFGPNDYPACGTNIPTPVR